MVKMTRTLKELITLASIAGFCWLMVGLVGLVGEWIQEGLR